jgi:hypothetical protein
MARMSLSDFITELEKRGFDGFESLDLVRYINFGYRTVGRLTKWMWEETDLPMTMAIGSYRWSLVSDLPTVKSVRAIVCTTVNSENRLEAITSDDFYDSWRAYDLTSSQNRGEPDRYYMDSAYIYILPPPRASRTYTLTVEQKLTELVSGSNETPITPEEYDEAILIAAEEHCHIRARQPAFADVNRKKLMEFFDDALADEGSRMQDAPQRIRAGRTCL